MGFGSCGPCVFRLLFGTLAGGPADQTLEKKGAFVPVSGLEAAVGVKRDAWPETGQPDVWVRWLVNG